jgi:hypothetical protein
MEPARSRRTGILQVKESSTVKGIKPPIEARFLRVKEKRQPPLARHIVLVLESYSGFDPAARW